MGLDGVILTAFILGFPANEIVLPIIIMIYLSTNVMMDITDISFEEPTIKQELEELGYRFTRTIPPTNTTNQQTVIDAFDDGRCYFPAPETPGLGDDLTPADNQ